MVQVGEVRFCRTGASGNIFCVMGGARKILNYVGRRDDANEMTQRVYGCGSYEEALEIIGEYVRLVEFDDEI